MKSIRLVVLTATLVAVSAYGPPKKSAVLPSTPAKYDTIGSLNEKKGEDVLYVKGQPVEGAKDIIDETDSYGGKYGAEKKDKEIKIEEGGLDLGNAGGDYGKAAGHGKELDKKPYGGDSYTKEVKDIKYDAVDDKGKFEGPKEESKYGGFGGEVKEVKEKKYEKGYGGDKKEIIKEDDKSYGKDSEGGYLIPSDDKPFAFPKEGFEEGKTAKDDYGSTKVEESFKEGGAYEAPKGGYGKALEGKKDGYGAEEKFEEKPIAGPKGVFEESKFPKSGYGSSKGGFVDEKIDESFKGGAAYEPKGPKGGFAEEKIEEPIKEGGDFGGGKQYGSKGYGKPKGGYGEEKIEENIKEGGAYGGSKGYDTGSKGFGEEKIVETVKEGGYGTVGKPLEPSKGFGYEEKEIKTTKYGDEKPISGGYGGPEPYEPKPGGSITTMSTKTCNKMMDGLLGKLQHSFTSHMNTYKVDKVSPLSIGSWARVRLYDGKFEKIGQICRGGDFQVLPQGENIVIRGTISVPEPKAKFCGDAYLYNRLKVRNRNLALCAKDASFRMQMIINKRAGKVDVDELEPLAIHGFHVEDDKGLRADGLAWPFNKIRDNSLNKQKYQFMSTLQHKLCDDFRQIVAKPEVKREIIDLV